MCPTTRISHLLPATVVSPLHRSNIAPARTRFSSSHPVCTCDSWFSASSHCRSWRLRCSMWSGNLCWKEKQHRLLPTLDFARKPNSIRAVAGILLFASRPGYNFDERVLTNFSDICGNPVKRFKSTTFTQAHRNSCQYFIVLVPNIQDHLHTLINRETYCGCHSFCFVWYKNYKQQQNDT